MHKQRRFVIFDRCKKFSKKLLHDSEPLIICLSLRGNNDEGRLKSRLKEVAKAAHPELRCRVVVKKFGTRVFCPLNWTKSAGYKQIFRCENTCCSLKIELCD